MRISGRMKEQIKKVVKYSYLYRKANVSNHSSANMWYIKYERAKNRLMKNDQKSWVVFSFRYLDDLVDLYGRTNSPYLLTGNAMGGKDDWKFLSAYF